MGKGAGPEVDSGRSSSGQSPKFMKNSVSGKTIYTKRREQKRFGIDNDAGKDIFEKSVQFTIDGMQRCYNQG